MSDKANEQANWVGSYDVVHSFYFLELKEKLIREVVLLARDKSSEGSEFKLAFLCLSALL